jgi:hypothetical protein
MGTLTNKALAIFERSPAAKIATTRTLLMSSAARIATLERNRGAALVGDNIETVRDIDRELDEQRRASATYRDRIAALEAAQRRQDHAERVRQHHEAIDKIVAPAIAEYVQHGAELQKAFLHFLDLWEQVPEKRSAVHLGWPAAASRPPFSDLHIDNRTNPFDHVTNVRYSAKQIAERIATNGAHFIEDCHKVAIPDPEDDQTAQDAAA